MRLLSLAIATASIATLLSASTAFACDCAVLPEKKRFRNSDAAVVMRLVDVKPVSPDGQRSELTYRILRVYKGPQTLQRGSEFTMTNDRGNSCAVRETEGRYAAYLYRSQGQFLASSCSFTRPKRMQRAARRLGRKPRASQDNDKSSPRPAVCTAIGCDSGVTVQLRRLPSAAEKATVCVRGRCKTLDLSDEREARMRCTKRPQRARVAVAILDEEGEKIAGARRKVRLRRPQPNGPDCPPTCYTARLLFDGETGTLTRLK